MFTEPNGGRNMTLPERLKAAREARGWTVEDVGARLKLPARVIARVERGDFEDLGAPIYRRGYLRSFARLVDIPDDDVDPVIEQNGSTGEPELIATGVMPRSEYMLERYLRPATYIALTALIALPVVWWAASGQLGRELAERRSFDLQPPPLATSDAPGVAVEPERPEPLPPTVSSPQTELVRASMMSVPQQLERANEDTAPQAEPVLPDEMDQLNELPDEVIGSGVNEAILELSARSWVKVTADGQHLHQALLTPGTWRYRSDGRLFFTIGNSRNARLTADGEAVDLNGYRSANDVARIELFGENG